MVEVASVISSRYKKLCSQSKILTGLASYDSTASNTDIHKWLTKINIL